MHQSDDKVVTKRRGSSPLSSSYTPPPSRTKASALVGWQTNSTSSLPSRSFTTSNNNNGPLHLKDDSLRSFQPTPEAIDLIADPLLMQYKLHLLDSLNEGVAIIDTEDGAMKIVSVNSGFERMTGWKAHEVLGSTLHFLQGMATNEKGVETVLLGLEHKRHVRVLLVSYRRNRTTFWNSIYTVPLPPSQDSTESRYVAVVMTDVTEWYEKDGVSKDCLHGSPGRLTAIPAPRPRPQNSTISNAKPMAKKLDDVSIICINFTGIHEYLESFSDSSLAMKLLRDLMEMVDSSLTYFPSIRKVKMSGSGFVGIGGIPVHERVQDPLQAMKSRLPPRRSTASETDLQIHVERMERVWYEVLSNEDEDEEDGTMRRTLSGSEVTTPSLEDLLGTPSKDLAEQEVPFPTAISQSYPQTSFVSPSSSPITKSKTVSLSTGSRRRGNSAPARPTSLMKKSEEQESTVESEPSNNAEEDIQDSSSLFHSAMQSSLPIIREEPKESKKKLSAMKRKLMIVKERREKVKEKQKEKVKEKEKEDMDPMVGSVNDKPWQQIEPKGIEKLKELNKESKRNKKNKALEEMAAFALTVIIKFTTLSDSVLKVERRKATQAKVATRERSGSIGSRSGTDTLPTEMSLKIGMHIGRAMVGSLPLSLISPTPAGSGLQSLPEVWGEAYETATSLCSKANDAQAMVSAAVYDRICHKFKFREAEDKKNYHLCGYRVK